MLNHSVLADSLQLLGLPARLCLWNFPGKNTGVGCHFLFQRIFPTQESNPCLLHWQVDSLPLHQPGRWHSGKASTWNVEDRFYPWIRKIPGEGNCNPLQYSCLGNPIDRGAWRATVHGVTSVWPHLVTKPSPPYAYSIIYTIIYSIYSIWPSKHSPQPNILKYL